MAEHDRPAQSGIERHPDTPRMLVSMLQLRQRRPDRTGSIYRRGDGLWVGAYLEQGRRRYVYSKRRDSVEEKLQRRLRGDRRHLRGIRDQDRVLMAQAIVERVLRRAARRGWDLGFTSRVILASLAPRRVAAGVVGPCFYCGDPLASTVDHLIPTARGGTDDQWNLTSACHMCNSRKGNLTAEEFIAQRGSSPP